MSLKEKQKVRVEESTRNEDYINPLSIRYQYIGLSM